MNKATIAPRDIEPVTVTVCNAQRRVPVQTGRMARLARAAARRLRIAADGTLAITFLDARQIRRLNRRFLRHDRVTDVLCFRYDDEPASLPLHRRDRQVVGEIFIAPSTARDYAKRHGIPYGQELARYVVHGLLHWTGLEDGSAAQQARMRRAEDRLLARCGGR